MRHFVVTDRERYISRPVYPGYYYSNRNYNWRIAVPKGKYIQVKFVNFGYPDSITCPRNLLKMYGGESVDDAASEKYNGNFDLLHSIQMEDIYIPIFDLIHLL